MQPAGLVTPRGHRTRIAVWAITLLILASPAVAQKAPAAAAKPTTTLDRIKAAGKVRFGYRSDAQPFSYKDGSGAAGYSVALCQKVADAIKTETGLATLNVEWVPVTLEGRFNALREGQIDLLCGADTETLARRQEVDFSIPIFPGGIGAVLRTDSPPRLREILNNRPPSSPTWRASAGQLLQTQAFAVVKGTTSETWLSGKLAEFKLTAKVVPVDDYAAGIQRLLDHKADVFFADRAILLDAAARNKSSDKLVVLDRYFTYDPLRLAVAHDDPAFRLLVDRTISRLYTSGEMTAVYQQSFGSPDANALNFFRWNILPD